MIGQDRESVTAAFDGPFDASTFAFKPQAPAAAVRRRPAHGVLLVVAAVHALLLMLLTREPVPPTPAADALLVEFLSIPADAPPPPSPQPTRAPAPPRAAASPRPRPAVDAPPPRRGAMQAIEIAPDEPVAATPAGSARLFDDSGRIVVPDSALEELRRNVSDDRVFDYQVAGLAQARKAFQRRPPLVYDRSMFEDGMRPTKDLLSDLLSRAVEASTMSISIPIPGDPYRRIECKVVVLAAGGGCGMTGFTGYVEEDDPDTLNPEEEAQCAAWWEKITTTQEQGAWLDTRALYDANCRKPKENKPARS